MGGGIIWTLPYYYYYYYYHHHHHHHKTLINYYPYSFSMLLKNIRRIILYADDLVIYMGRMGCKWNKPLPRSSRHSQHWD